MSIVYQHRRNDTNEIFYIGIGKTEKRAYSKHSRNNYWKRVIKKYGYKVEILKTNLTWQKACTIEIQLIKKYGRKDLKLGNLVNMTDGGEGSMGLIFSKDSRDKISKAHLGKKYSKETRDKMSTSKLGNNYCLGKKHSQKTKDKLRKINLGEKHSQETKDKMSESQLGNKNALGNKSWLGGNLSQEHKDKMSKTLLGKKLSQKTKDKMKIAGKLCWKNKKAAKELGITYKEYIKIKNENN